MWKNLLNGRRTGSEGGTVLLDEEYKGACRTTLEECAGYYAITCGVYGAMCHTVFRGDDYQGTYEAMQAELQAFVDSGPTERETSEFCERFTNKF